MSETAGNRVTASPSPVCVAPGSPPESSSWKANSTWWGLYKFSAVPHRLYIFSSLYDSGSPPKSSPSTAPHGGLVPISAISVFTLSPCGSTMSRPMKSSTSSRVLIGSSSKSSVNTTCDATHVRLLHGMCSEVDSKGTAREQERNRNQRCILARATETHPVVKGPCIQSHSESRQRTAQGNSNHRTQHAAQRHKLCAAFSFRDATLAYFVPLGNGDLDDVLCPHSKTCGNLHTYCTRTVRHRPCRMLSRPLHRLVAGKTIARPKTRPTFVLRRGTPLPSTHRAWKLHRKGCRISRYHIQMMRGKNRSMLHGLLSSH